MSLLDDYLARDATDLAALVREGQIKPAELLEAALERAARVNPRINAIVIPMDAIARARAGGAEGELRGPFAGVPFLLKDLHQDYQGVSSTGGVKALRDAKIPAAEHSEITRRWLEAGTVIFGRTNSPEFGAKGITEPDAWGPTRNPWNLDHTPGGSSGGAAAAVAAGIVPAAGASDGAGSIRIPSAYTHLFGLKPGRGRTPSGPKQAEALHGAAMQHVISRSVRDSAGLLDATHGPELSSWTRIAPPSRPYVEEVAREPGRLRVAFSTRSPIGTPVHPEAVKAVEAAARLLEGLGHHVEEAAPVLDGRALAQDFLRMWFAHMAVNVDEVRALTGTGDQGFELDTLAMAALGRALPATDYVKGYRRWNEYGLALALFFVKYDVYLTPTVASPPPRVGEVRTPPAQAAILKYGFKVGLQKVLGAARAVVEKAAIENLKHVPFTQLANLTGVPAMSVPLHRCANGLPLGVQFLAPHGGEGRLFCLAGQLERAQPWALERAAL